MKKVAIVSELNLNNVNYGNRLQAFALNYYINKTLKIKADSLIFTSVANKKITKKYIRGYSKIIVKKLLQIIKNNNNCIFEKRLNECNRFTLDNTNVLVVKNKKTLKNEQYNYYIVGSDVVWAQYPNEVSKIKLLDFKGLSEYKKISYAASFRKNWIPEENKKYLKKQLKTFNYISVREQSSIDLLKTIDIQNAVHTCDPTLLLNKEEWMKFVKPVDNISKGPYIFTYLLGKSKEQRDAIKKYAKEIGCLIINIPNADMKENQVDENFGDVSISDCSPEQWLWLIKNAELVITDSFHGCVFSNIFMKKYVVLKREKDSKKNIRIDNFLEYINETDKLISNLDFNDTIKHLVWDYKKSNSLLNQLIKQSKHFLDKSLDVKKTS